jgi:hypothetical protein
MRNKGRLTIRLVLLASLVMGLTLISTRLHADTGTCGGQSITLPFTDVTSSPFFCQIAEAFFSGLTNGTSPTTYSPSSPVPREQMAAFIHQDPGFGPEEGEQAGSAPAVLDHDSSLPQRIRRAGDDHCGEPPVFGRIRWGGPVGGEY